MDREKLWQTVLENLKINLSSASFTTWFTQTFITQVQPLDQERQIVEIGCPNPFAKDTIENRYYGLIKQVLDQATNKKTDLVFVIKQIPGKAAKTEKGPLFKVFKPKPVIKEAIDRVGLRPDFTFDSFAVSSTNQMAHAAAQAVAQSPGKSYNPLFLYGGVGVGKTHLMQAIAHAVINRNPRTRIVYCSGEEFTNEIVQAIRRKTTDEFKKKYRQVRILLVDDIQFIAGKEKAQEEFFHTFNAIWRAGGQVILTSDQRPEEINKLEARLRSRFEGGLTIDIQNPDFELRTAILLIKAQQRKIRLPMDVAQLVAGNITSTRKLEGFLVRLISESQTKKTPINVEFAGALLGHINGSTTPKRLVRPREMISTVATYYQLKVSDLTGERRLKEIAFPRQVLMYLLRTELKLSLMEIGRILGNRDHTTVMHGVEKITKLLPESEDLRVDTMGIRKKVYG